MTNTRKIVTALGMALAVASLSGEAFAQNRTSTGELLRRMDINKNRVVSREEFLRYQARRGRSRAEASRTFSGLDVNRSGQLEVAELRPMTSPNFSRCETLALHRGIAVNEREGHRPDVTGPSAWKQFMDACLAGKIR